MLEELLQSSLEYLEDDLGGGVNWEGGWNMDLIEIDL